MAQCPPLRICHEASYSVDWDSIFGGSPPPISQTDNDPYVLIADEVDADEVDADDSLIRFMRDDEGSEDCSSKVDLVKNFCAGANITTQKWGAEANQDADTQPIALVDDRSFDGRTAVPRRGPMTLTAEQLFDYLQTMVVSFLPLK
ncbi:hypothetical protein EIK77_000023 [Talaromyces pinophilus]|nr:hypothetical protein EIK77_000023 [Talaromyces pinophilus]